MNDAGVFSVITSHLCVGIFGKVLIMRTRNTSVFMNEFRICLLPMQASDNLNTNKELDVRKRQIDKTSAVH